MKVIFMGTPDFAENILKDLSKVHDIVLCVTQPDKESGRGKDIHYSPVKNWAIEHDVPVFQPEKIRAQEAIDYLSNITKLIDEYRNPAAHPEFVSFDKAKECKEFLPEQMDYLIECIK